MEKTVNAKGKMLLGSNLGKEDRGKKIEMVEESSVDNTGKRMLTPDDPPKKKQKDMVEQSLLDNKGNNSSSFGVSKAPLMPVVPQSMSFADVTFEEIQELHAKYKALYKPYIPKPKPAKRCLRTEYSQLALEFYKNKTGLDYKLVDVGPYLHLVDLKRGYEQGFHFNFFASLKDENSPVQLFFAEVLWGDYSDQILQCELVEGKSFAYEKASELDDVYHPTGMKCLNCAERTAAIKQGRGKWV